MNGLNKVFLIGFVGQDPELRSTAAGVSALSLNIATPNTRKVDGEWVSEPDWHRITAYGSCAEYLARSVRKGDVLSVEAALKPYKWVDSAGKTNYGINIVVSEVLALSPKRRAEVPEQPPEASPPPPRGPTDPGFPGEYS